MTPKIKVVQNTNGRIRIKKGACERLVVLSLAKFVLGDNFHQLEQLSQVAGKIKYNRIKPFVWTSLACSLYCSEHVG